MLKSIQFTSGFATKLAALGTNKFEFTPGLNILWGPNGCGKTTILRTLAAYSFTNGGWSHPIKKLELIELSGKTLKLPQDLHEIAPGKCKANVEWDGYPTFFYSSQDCEKSLLSGGVGEEAAEEIVSGIEKLSLRFEKPSAGQIGIYHLEKVLKILSKPRDIVDELKNADEAFYQIQRDYVAKRRSETKEHQITVLMDEIERALTPINQIHIWTVIIPSLLKAKFQVIIATHCPLALSNFDYPSNILHFGPRGELEDTYNELQKRFTKPLGKYTQIAIGRSEEMAIETDKPKRKSAVIKRR